LSFQGSVAANHALSSTGADPFTKDQYFEDAMDVDHDAVFPHTSAKISAILPGTASERHGTEIRKSARVGDENHPPKTHIKPAAPSDIHRRGEAMQPSALGNSDAAAGIYSPPKQKNSRYISADNLGSRGTMLATSALPRCSYTSHQAGERPRANAKAQAPDFSANPTINVEQWLQQEIAFQMDQLQQKGLERITAFKMRAMEVRRTIESL
jgi:hypothetical protein